MFSRFSLVDIGAGEQRVNKRLQFFNNATMLNNQNNNNLLANGDANTFKRRKKKELFQHSNTTDHGKNQPSTVNGIWAHVAVFVSLAPDVTRELVEPRL